MYYECRFPRFVATATGKWPPYCDSEISLMFYQNIDQEHSYNTHTHKRERGHCLYTRVCAAFNPDTVVLDLMKDESPAVCYRTC